jgi:ketosteroid isomerase-like protein
VHDGETNGQDCYRVADRDLSTHCRGLSQGKTPQDDALTTVQTFVSANGTANLELIVSTFDEAATVFFPGRPQRASGQGEIRDVFAELFKQRKGPITITPRDVSAQLFSDVAIITAHLRALPASPIREPTVFPRRTFVLRRVEGNLADRSSSRVEFLFATSTTVIAPNLSERHRSGDRVRCARVLTNPTESTPGNDTRSRFGSLCGATAFRGC